MRVVTAGALCLSLLGASPSGAATLRGRVYDPATNRGLAATVSVVVPYGEGPLRLDFPLPEPTTPGPRRIRADRMDARRLPPDGRFEFNHLAPGEKLVIVFPHTPGYAFAYARPVLADENDTQYVDFPLERGASVSGVVIDASGRALAGARVALVYTDAEILRLVDASGNSLQETEADPAGLFAFDRIKPGVSFRLEARTEELLPVLSETLALQPGETRPGLILRLSEKGFRVVITVVDEQAQPLPGISVVLSSTRPRLPELRLSPSEMIPISGFTDRQGRIEFRGVPPGRWVIFATEPPTAGTTRRRLRKEVELPESAIDKDVQVTIRPE